jgi:hypothetical protein
MDYKQRPNDPLFRDCVSTSLTEDELAFYLRQAWKEIYGTDINKNQLCILWCHTSLEIGRGKFIYNNNFGNIKRREGQPYTSYKCNEILNGKTHWFEPYHPQTFFQSWDSAVEGAKAYLQFLNKKRYQPALEALKAGNIYKYCAKLKEGGYFTADLNYYTNLMVKISKSFDKKSDHFMSFFPENYTIEIDIDLDKEPESLPVTVREPSITPISSNQKEIESGTTTLPSSPGKDEPLVSENKIIEVSRPKNKFVEIFVGIIHLIMKLFKVTK